MCDMYDRYDYTSVNNTDYIRVSTPTAGLVSTHRKYSDTPLCVRVAECAGPVSSTSHWRSGIDVCSGRTSMWAFQVYLLCLVYLLLECGDGIGTVGFATVSCA